MPKRVRANSQATTAASTQVSRPSVCGTFSVRFSRRASRATTPSPTYTTASSTGSSLTRTRSAMSRTYAKLFAVCCRMAGISSTPAAPQACASSLTSTIVSTSHKPTTAFLFTKARSPASSKLAAASPFAGATSMPVASSIPPNALLRSTYSPRATHSSGPITSGLTASSLRSSPAPPILTPLK